MARENNECFVSLKTLSKRTDISVRSWRSHIKDPDNPLPFYRVGSKIVIFWPDVLEWMKSKKEEKRPDTGARSIADEILYNPKSKD